MKVEVADQVVAYVKGLPPEPRRSLRLAIRNLEAVKGDIRCLEGPLSGYQRLRVGAPDLSLMCRFPKTDRRFKCT